MSRMKYIIDTWVHDIWYISIKTLCAPAAKLGGLIMHNLASPSTVSSSCGNVEQAMVLLFVLCTVGH